MDGLQAWLSMPIVQLCAVIFVALAVVLVVRALRGKPLKGDK